MVNAISGAHDTDDTAMSAERSDVTRLLTTPVTNIVGILMGEADASEVESGFVSSPREFCDRFEFGNSLITSLPSLRIQSARLASWGERMRNLFAA